MVYSTKNQTETSQNTTLVNWKGFTQHPRAQAIIEGLNDIPENWALTTVSNKRPYRDNWQKETPLTKEQIKESILNGEQLWSEEKQKYHRAFASGYGLRLGDVSNGLLAVDVDGESAQQLLNAIADGEIPQTVAWTSGKQGRYQMVFQVPEEYREWLKGFTKREIKELNGVKCESKEQLELRYNTMQSVLPCSHHPETGQYEWLVSPNEIEVATIPKWLLELAIEQREAEDLHQAAKADNSHQKPINHAYEQDTRELAEKALQYIPQRNPGGGNYYECLRVLMALESEFGDGAIALAEKWSPSIPGTTWNVPYKVKSIQKTAKTGITIATLFHIAKQHGFEMSKKAKPSGKSASSKGFGSDRAADQEGEEEQSGSLDIQKEIDRLLETNLEGSDLSIALTNLSQQTRQPYNQLRQLYDQRYEELRREEELEDRRKELDSILKSKNADIDIATVFPPPLANALKQMAKWLAVRPATFATALLCGVSALHHTESKVWLNKSWQFSVTPNLFGAIVAESSQKKSPILKTMVTKPMMTLQKQWELDYQQELERYNQKLAEWQNSEDKDPNDKPVEPRQRIAYFSNATPEGIASQASKIPDQGIMYQREELAGLFGDMDKYVNGKGGQLEDLLSFYDGTGGCNLRAGGVSANFYGVLISLFGTIQPEVLRKLMGDMDDDNGLWGRFLMVHQPLAKSVMEDDAGGVNLDELIFSIYQGIDNNKSADDYTLSNDAFQLFRDAYNHYEDLRTAPDTKPALRAMYGKAEGRIGKIAVNLHAIKCAVNGEGDDHIIDAETMQGAIALNDFFINQIFAIHGELDDEDNLSGYLAKIVQIAERANKPVSASDIKRSLSKRERKPVEQIKEAFYELERLGYGSTSGSNRSLKFTVGQKLVSQPTAETPSNSGVGDNESKKVGKSWSKVGQPTNSKSPSNGETQTKVGKVGQNNHFDNQSMEDLKDGEKENLESWQKSWQANQPEPTLPTNGQKVDTEGNQTVGQFNQLLTNSSDTDQLNNDESPTDLWESSDTDRAAEPSHQDSELTEQAKNLANPPETNITETDTTDIADNSSDRAQEVNTNGKRKIPLTEDDPEMDFPW